MAAVLAAVIASAVSRWINTAGSQLAPAAVRAVPVEDRPRFGMSAQQVGQE